MGGSGQCHLRFFQGSGFSGSSMRRKDPPHPPWLPELGQEAEPADCPGRRCGCGLRKARRVEDRPRVRGLCWGQAGSVSRRGHCSLEPRSCPPAHLHAGKGGGLSSDLCSTCPVSALGRSCPSSPAQGRTQVQYLVSTQSCLPISDLSPSSKSMGHRLVNAALAPGSSVPMPVWPAWG